MARGRAMARGARWMAETPAAAVVVAAVVAAAVVAAAVVAAAVVSSAKAAEYFQKILILKGLLNAVSILRFSCTVCLVLGRGRGAN